jgi:PAS domain S-box-containing protein
VLLVPALIRLALGFVLLALAAHPAAGDEPKRVLIIHSFGRTAPPFATPSTAFETALTEELGDAVELDEVSLDMARNVQPGVEQHFVQFLVARLSTRLPELVVPIGSPAGRFVVKYRDRLFPRASVIYTAMDRRTLPVDALEHNAAFVGESFDLARSIEDILQIAPDTNHIAVVIGASPLERFWTKTLHEAAQPFEGRVRFTWMDNLSFDEMLRRAASLPRRSFIFLALLLRDASGVAHNQYDALQRLHEVASAPIYGLFQNQLGLGLVGGHLYQVETAGVESARVAVRVLRGEPISKFPPTVIPALSPRYDWRELQRWGISESNLPAGSAVLFRRPTVWQRYGWWIAGILCIGLIQAVLIAQLGVSLARRRRTERALRESESRFRTVADFAPVLIWMAGVDKRCTFFNKPWLEFTGRTVEQEVGDGWVEGVHPDDVTQCLKGYVESFDARRPFMLHYRLRRHDGEYRWIADHGVPRYDATGAFAGYIGSGSDVTERLRAEARFRQVLEAAPNAMIMVNRDGRITLINVQTERLFGYRRDELLGQPIEVLIPERFRARHSELRTPFADAPQARMMGAGRNLFGRRKDGSEMPVEIGLNPIPTEDGLLFVASVVDITERRRAATETQNLRDELAHMSRVATVGELTAAIIHELSQPLSAITANAKAGLRLTGVSGEDGATVREILSDIVADNRRASQVIENMRTLFRKRADERQLLSLNGLINDMASVLVTDALLHDMSVTLELASELPLVSGNRVQLQQVILNLVMNAFDAMSENTGGPRSVVVRTRSLEGRAVQVEVADAGPGIASAVLTSIFEPFVTTKTSGMGIGLSVSRSIVTAHDGKIWAENNANRGATVYVVLPTISS